MPINKKPLKSPSRASVTLQIADSYTPDGKFSVTLKLRATEFTFYCSSINGYLPCTPSYLPCNGFLLVLYIITMATILKALKSPSRAS